LRVRGTRRRILDGVTLGWPGKKSIICFNRSFD
jgi:hypothetical protein